MCINDESIDAATAADNTTNDDVFSCNLVENAKKHKWFLETLHKLGYTTTNNGSTKRESLRRYQTLWLPLVYDQQQEKKEQQLLIPPPDVAWLWHCHRLAPKDYTEYIRKTFFVSSSGGGASYSTTSSEIKVDTMLEANPPFTFQFPPNKEEEVTSEATSKRCKKDDDNSTYCHTATDDGSETSPTTASLISRQTQTIWDLRYPEESFFLRVNNEENENGGSSEGNKVIHDDDDDEKMNENEQLSSSSSSSLSSSLLVGGFDLLASIERQATFLWQVSGERFDDTEFLQDGLENYRRFLQLKPLASKSRVILVPTYQIDMMWHTHILSSLTDYDKDCRIISGSTLHHDDSLTDRSDGGILDRSYNTTKDIWKKEYGTDYAVEGGMYRGEPPSVFFDAKWNSDDYSQTAGYNFHLVGRMGASSTSPPVTKWATHKDTTSAGKPAFIPTNTTKRSQLATLPRRDDYVLGKQPNGIGYWHSETREFHNILYKRLSLQSNKLETDIACSTCCGGASHPLIITKQENLDKMLDTRDMLADRLGASKPNAKLKTRNRRSDGTDTNYDANTALWYYPATMYETCGGACGGGVA